MKTLEEVPMIVAESREGYGAGLVRSHRDLKIYQRAFELANQVCRLSREFPPEERYGITAQVRDSSRSVCANLAEAWRNRRYRTLFTRKLNISEAEAAETQCWLEFCLAEDYIDQQAFDRIWSDYEALIGALVGMAQHADKWVLKSKSQD